MVLPSKHFGAYLGFAAFVSAFYRDLFYATPLCNRWIYLWQMGCAHSANADGDESENFSAISGHTLWYPVLVDFWIESIYIQYGGFFISCYHCIGYTIYFCT
ncbi:hypothetical protein D3C74_438460 [compost metagenome]